jgi:hypothetical protein
MASTLGACAAVLATAAGALAALPGGAQYSGTTNDGRAVHVTLSADGRRVARLEVQYALRCRGNVVGSSFTTVTGALLNGSGRFDLAGSYSGSRDHSTNRFKTSGTVTADTATGSFTLASSLRRGRRVQRCHTGALSFTARRAP